MLNEISKIIFKFNIEYHSAIEKVVYKIEQINALKIALLLEIYALEMTYFCRKWNCFLWKYKNLKCIKK